MILSKKMKKALDVVVGEVASAWVETCEDEYDPDVFEEDDEMYSLKQFTFDDWMDNGYELMDSVNEYIDKEVKKQLK